MRGIFNLAGPEPVPLSRIIKILDRQRLSVPVLAGARRCCGDCGRCASPTFPPPELDHIRYVCMVDDRRARQVLGFTPQVPLEDTVRSRRRGTLVRARRSRRRGTRRTRSSIPATRCIGRRPSPVMAWTHGRRQASADSRRPSKNLVGSLQPGSSSPVELEKLKAGLSLVVEDQKTKLAEAAEDGHTWLDITKGVTPLLVTGILGLVGSLVTLRWQSKDTVASGNRQAQELQASEEAKARQDRTALLQQLAQSVSSGPRPSPSCWYVQGIWSDYSKDEPLPDVLASRCSAGYAEDGGLALGPTPDGGIAGAGAHG